MQYLGAAYFLWHLWHKGQRGEGIRLRWTVGDAAQAELPGPPLLQLFASGQGALCAPALPCLLPAQLL